MGIAVCFFAAQEALAAGYINGISVSEDTIELSIITTAGTRYMIQECTDLVSEDWENTGSFLAHGSSTNRMLNRVESSCFYRVIEIKLAFGRIRGISPSGSNVELNVETKEGGRYILQECVDLAGNIWQDTGSSFTASGDSTVRTLPMHGSSCFFRVVVLVDPSAPDSPPPPPPGPGSR